MAKPLTLLTDFGLEDSYVGIMKGVINDIVPDAVIIDLTHQIPPQDRWAARFNLMNAIPYFPKDTVHVAVVDPGVGSDRRSVVIGCPDGYLVGPDNGIFSGVFLPYLEQGVSLTAVSLTNPDYWRSPHPSYTFHGRDIFAPVGAHLVQGVPPEKMGDRIDPTSLITLNLPALQRQGNELLGCIQYSDRFGNLVTTIPASMVREHPWQVSIGHHSLQGRQTYASVEKGELVALIGSHGWVEVAMNGGNAKHYLSKEHSGDDPWPVKITLSNSSNS